MNVRLSVIIPSSGMPSLWLKTWACIDINGKFVWKYLAGKCKILWEKSAREPLFHHKLYWDYLAVVILSSLYVAGVTCLSGYTIRKFKKVKTELK
jgi:hypothetical protein